MTDDELRETLGLIDAIYGSVDYENERLAILRALVGRAVREERESIALSVWPPKHIDSCRCKRCREYMRIAAAIRARAK